MARLRRLGQEAAILFAGLLLSAPLIQSQDDQSGFEVLDFIDPFIGTANGGHSFAGATLPFGMVKAVADTEGENQGGFAYDTTKVTGFSHTHDSGTGGCNWTSSDRAVAWRRDSPKARPGYFSISLENGVDAEMTVTNHSALYRFSFPGAVNPSPVVLVDIIDLPQSRNSGTASVNPETGRLTGSGNFNPSFGLGTYNAYFCADFRGGELRDTGTWTNRTAAVGETTVSVVADSSHPAGHFSAGAFAHFNSVNSGVLTVRVGFSWLSVEQACSNAEREQPDFDFDGTADAAEFAWRNKIEPIAVNADGVSSDLQTVFWSGVYRTMISPQDYTGENPLWDSDEPYYDSFYW
ncbi:hypothetical protein ASPCAL12828 [Aspergillus calidoustus]|uniref:Glycoside hydrolase family 92 protein n=1 Tax=Aspergillus calidoustus TaxID=454130 RepID=A0A0U5GIN5_ASPCI|nr:hypothetical protein ASPCAL12828 [Aspergillus calidoustus]